MTGDNCGPAHDGCDCKVECPECGGRLEQNIHLCDCPLCTFDSEEIPTCVNCEWEGEDWDVLDVGTWQRESERKKLEEWKAWATP